MSIRNEGYLCRYCGSYHADLPMSYGSSFPDYYYEIPPEEQDRRIEKNEDVCIIDNDYFFIRGCIEIPVIDGKGPFNWVVWISLSEANFNKTMEYWQIEGREEKVDPMFGWLSTAIPCYPVTTKLSAMVHTRPVGMRPYIELEPIEHPLAKEQKEGITYNRIMKIAEELCGEI